MDEGISPQTITADIGQLHQLAEVYTEYKEAADYLSKTEKTVESKCYFESNESTVEGRKMDAKRNPLYEEHIQQMIKMQVKALKAKLNYDIAMVRLDLIRSMESTHRKLL